MSTNLYKLLLNLLPAPALQVGTVQSANNGVCTLELPGGGVTNARGNASIGSIVFFKDGVIEGNAPSLTVELIDV